MQIWKEMWSLIWKFEISNKHFQWNSNGEKKNRASQFQNPKGEIFMIEWKIGEANRENRWYEEWVIAKIWKPWPIRGNEDERRNWGKASHGIEWFLSSPSSSSCSTFKTPQLRIAIYLIQLFQLQPWPTFCTTLLQLEVSF